MTQLGNRYSDDKGSRGGVPDAASGWDILEGLIVFWKCLGLDLHGGVATHLFLVLSKVLLHRFHGWFKLFCLDQHHMTLRSSSEFLKRSLRVRLAFSLLVHVLEAPVETRMAL